MQLGSMVGTGHGRRCHADSRESRDVDFGGRPPNEDIDAGRPPICGVWILVNDGVIRFAEMLNVLAIDLFDDRRSTHVLLPNDGRSVAVSCRDYQMLLIKMALTIVPQTAADAAAIKT